MSPFWMSAETGMKGTSIEPSLPEPTATARRPLRTSITGTDWSFSVTSVTSLVNGADVGDLAHDAGAVDHRHARRASPCVRPLSTTILRVKGLRAV